jgi:hypothetical protein
VISHRPSDGSIGMGLEGPDRRAAALRDEQARKELRQSKLDALTSPFAEPSERIRQWEDLYGLRLPRSAEHRLVRVIAQRTALSPQQIQDEQRRRASA